MKIKKGISLIDQHDKNYLYGKKFGENIPVKFHSDIRSRESCLKSTTYAINLAKKFNSQLHVLHVSTKEELDLFSWMVVDGLNPAIRFFQHIPKPSRRVRPFRHVVYHWQTANRAETNGLNSGPSVHPSGVSPW